MSTFAPKSYTWLSSFFRDEIKNAKQDCCDAEITIEYIIKNLSHELKIENPNFNENRFLHNIYCGKNHLENEVCQFGYVPIKSLENI